jgi:hypothetical protein
LKPRGANLGDAVAETRASPYHRRQKGPLRVGRTLSLQLGKDVMDIPLAGSWHVTLFWGAWLIGAILLLAIGAVALVARVLIAR